MKRSIKWIVGAVLALLAYILVLGLGKEAGKAGRAAVNFLVETLLT